MSAIVRFSQTPMLPVSEPSMYKKVKKTLTNVIDNIFKPPAMVQAMTTSLLKAHELYKEHSKKPTAVVIDHVHPDVTDIDESSEESILAAVYLLHRRSISQEAGWINDKEQQPWDGVLYVKLDRQSRTTSY